MRSIQRIRYQKTPSEADKVELQQMVGLVDVLKAAGAVDIALSRGR